MTPLQKILTTYRATSQSEREKGSYFEELIRTYFRYKVCFQNSNGWSRGCGLPLLDATEKGLFLADPPPELSRTPDQEGNEHQIWVVTDSSSAFHGDLCAFAVKKSFIATCGSTLEAAGLVNDFPNPVFTA